MAVVTVAYLCDWPVLAQNNMKVDLPRVSSSENFVSRRGETRKKNQYVRTVQEPISREKTFEPATLFKRRFFRDARAAPRPVSDASATGKVRRISGIRIQVMAMIVLGPRSTWVYVAVKPMQIAFPKPALTDLKAI